MDNPQDDTADAAATSLPVSPQGTQSEFEALIDLLATDGPPASAPNPESNLSEAGQILRDEDGRLDFLKIKSLFSSKARNQDTHHPIQSTHNNVGDRGQDEYGGRTHVQVNLKSAEAPQEHPNPSRTTNASLSAPSTTVENTILETGLPPGAVESTPRAAGARELSRDNFDLIDLSSDQPPWSPESGNDKQMVEYPEAQQNNGWQPDPIRPTRTRTGKYLDDAALSLARQEVEALRQRCKELEDLVRKFRDLTSSEQECEPGGEQTFTPWQVPSVSELSHEEVHPPLSLKTDAAQRDEIRTGAEDKLKSTFKINDLSLSQSHIALTSLLNELALPASCVPALLKGGHKRRVTSTSSLEDIHRALDLVTFTDELVWRRSRLGAIHANPYSEDNIQALRDRLELWERAVRTPRS